MITCLLSLVMSASPARAVSDDPQIGRIVAALGDATEVIDRDLAWRAETRDINVIAEGLLQAVARLPFIDFYWLERRLRRLGTDVYLIAQPREMLEPGTCVQALWSVLPAPEFSLWISVNGRDEMLATLARFGIPNERQNRENLTRTGLKMASGHE